MYRLFLLLSFFLVKAEGGELIVALSPLSVKFIGDAPVDQSVVPEILSAAMGFTTQQESDWDGMTITDPFGFAEAVVVLYVDGVSTLGKSSTLPKYIVNSNEDEFSTWKAIKNKVMDRYPLENNTLVKIDLSHFDKEIDNIKTKHLSKNVVEEGEFLKEISNLNKLMKNERKLDGVPDLYWFTLKSLHLLSDLKGSFHPGTLEAKEMVFESLLKLAKDFDAVYHNKALVVALVSDASHTRRARSVANEKPETSNITGDHEDNVYDPDFPIIFNIILWFTVALIFVLLSVSVFIGSMDPGRDSIIYRMTSNKMKKDS